METATKAEAYSEIYFDQTLRFVRKLNALLINKKLPWRASMDSCTGCLYFEKEGVEGTLYATPFYEDEQAIMIDISFYQGVDMIEFYDKINFADEELTEEPSFDNLFSMYINHLPVLFALFEAKINAVKI